MDKLNPHHSSRTCHRVGSVCGDQGLLAAMVADKTPPRIHGTAFGIFNLVTRMALLAGKVVAGLLWDYYDPPSTFFTGAGITAVALAGLAGLACLHGNGYTRQAKGEG